MPRLLALWERLRDSLWFVPSLIVLSAIILGVLMIEASTLVDDEVLARWPRILGAGPEGARSMLAAIAGSMITVAGVTFSITMVAVTQASAQYSPRILRNFMRDRANQAVLGVFVGVFAYCLVVLRTIRESETSEFVPSLAVLTGVLLALLGVAVLIFFVHHIASTLQASEIIARITRDTRGVLDRLYQEEGAAEDAPDMPDLRPDRWHEVAAPATGYLQRANVEGLVRLADRHDLLVRLDRPTGEFVVRGRPVASFAPHPDRAPSASGGHRNPKELADALARQLVVGNYRTLDHDPSFGIRQLVDIALKALSPGVNDGTTAVTCIDYLGGLLVGTAGRRRSLQHRGVDASASRVRVITCEPGFETLLDMSVDEIRQHARGNVAVLLRQLGMLREVASAGADRAAVAVHVELVRRAAEETVIEPYDLERIQAAAQRALEPISARSSG
jgi:uncharacterized membrane protein